MQYNAKAIGIYLIYSNNIMVIIKFLVSRVWFRRGSNNTPGRVPQGWHGSIGTTCDQYGYPQCGHKTEE